MTTDEAKQMRSAQHHHQAMEECDVADIRVKKGDYLGQISFLQMAVHNETRAAWYALPHGITQAVLYRSATTIARQLSECLAKVGLASDLDPQLRRELTKLARSVK